MSRHLQEKCRAFHEKEAERGRQGDRRERRRSRRRRTHGRQHWQTGMRMFFFCSPLSPDLHHSESLNLYQITLRTTSLYSEEVTEKENASLVCQIGWEVSVVVGRSDRVRQEEKQGSNIIDGCGLGTARDGSSEPGSARTAATAQVPCRLDMNLLRSLFSVQTLKKLI